VLVCPWGMGSGVQISSPRPFFIFGAFEGQVERLFVGGPEGYPVGGAVQKHSFQQFAAFAVVARKVQKMRLLREFKSPFDGQYVLGGNRLAEAGTCRF
jgi:hypothetical protein